MAGSYPDVPGYRFAYDVDGTVGAVTSISGGTVTNITTTDMQKMNQNTSIPADSGSRFDSRNYVGGAGSNYIILLFPEVRSINGYMFLTHWQNNPSGGRVIQTSTDTTNGSDGAWTTQVASYPQLNGDAIGTSPLYRTAINSVSWNNIKAVRWAITHVGWAFHIYGFIPPSESPNRLRIVDMSTTSSMSDGITPTGEDMAAQLDFGNIAQRASSTKQFKVINNSTVQTANNITVSLNVPSNANPSLIGQYQISTDNIAFANAINIGALAPSTESGTLYVRMNPASNAQLGPWSARLIAHPTSWS